MHLRRFITVLAAGLTALLAPAVLHGQARDDQFKRDAFSQNYTDTSKQAKTDSSQLFSFKQYFGSLAHKRPGQVQNLFMGSTVFVGGGQIYNRQYWKLPVVYGGIGAGVGMGVYFNNQYKTTGDEKFKKYSTWSFVGAGLVWWGSLLDMTANFKTDRRPDPGKSTVYSILLPGLGQVYNGEYWKIPIYWGAMAGGVYYYATNRRNYQRYKWIYDQATSTEPDVEKPPISAENALYYRDVFRRYRDYSILATALFYVVQIVDANVFAYMQDFEMDDDISLRIEPTVITPEFASAPAMGVGLTLRF
jgi:26S proteasome regulatory complex component